MKTPPHLRVRHLLLALGTALLAASISKVVNRLPARSSTGGRRPEPPASAHPSATTEPSARVEAAARDTDTGAPRVRRTASALLVGAAAVGFAGVTWALVEQSILRNAASSGSSPAAPASQPSAPVAGVPRPRRMSTPGRPADRCDATACPAAARPAAACQAAACQAAACQAGLRPERPRRCSRVRRVTSWPSARGRRPRRRWRRRPARRRSTP